MKTASWRRGQKQHRQGSTLCLVTCLLVFRYIYNIELDVTKVGNKKGS